MQSFRKLIVWQKAEALSDQVDIVCDRIGRLNRRLADQLRDATASIPATIAEGCGRATDPDFANFVSMAIGSCNEVENHLQRAYRRKYISDEEHASLTAAVVEIRMMLCGLRNRLKPRR